MSVFIKICLVGAEMFHTYGRTDIEIDLKERTAVCRTFASAPDNYVLIVSGGPFC